MGRSKTFIREDVLDRAIQLFWKKGYADTSLSDLEKATGVNKSGLYSEFKDKDDLFVECLKRYRDGHPMLELLARQPLGWGNIEAFMKLGMTCQGQKGCFLAYTLRELSIVPQAARRVIEQNVQLVRDGVLANLVAAGVKKDHEMVTNLLMTFNTGVSLKLNAMKPEALLAEADAFLRLLKAQLG